MPLETQAPLPDTPVPDTPVPAALAPVAQAKPGEMATRLYAHDWQATVLGSMDQWPQSLRTAVQIVLNSRFPMFVWWGDELINIYNDAYIQVLGAKHPKALGQPARQIWSGIWPQISSRVDSVIVQNQATFDEDMFLLMERSGYPEETYFTFSYSPLYGDQGGVAGLFCTCTEETAKVIGERRLHTLRELSRQAADSNHSLDGACRAAIATLIQSCQDIPFACLYLADTVSPQPLYSYTTHAGLDSQLWELTEPLQTRSASWHVIVLPSDLGMQATSWEQPLQQAVILRLDVSAQSAAPNAMLVLGVSPLCPLNGAYQEYLRLIASQIAVTISRAYEEERYRLVMQATHDGIWDYNLGTRKAVWDGLFYDMLGYHPDEVDDPSLDFVLHRIHPEDRSYVASRWRQCVQEKTAYQAQYRLRHRDGHYLSVVSKGTPVLDRHGVAYRMVGVIANITEEERATQAMRESEARFRAIADEAPVYIFIADVDMKVTFFNKTWLTYTGLSFDEAIGLSWQHITPPEDIELVRDQYGKAVANREPFSFEIRHRGARDGHYRWTLWQGIPRYLPDGQFLGFMGSGIDIHERKELEVALARSEGHFRRVANKAPVMLWITNEDHHCTYINQTWLDFTGQTLDEIQGFGWLDKIHPDDVDLAKTAFVEAATRQSFFQVDYRLLRLDGQYRWMADAGAPLFDADGRFLGYVGYVVDIHERKQMEHDLHRAKQQAEDASRKKSEFLALMSHELRTPLNAILGYSRMIETGMMGPVNDKQARYLGNVGNSGQHLLTLINDLLDVSKVEAGKMDIVRECVAIAPLVAEVQTMIEAFARKQSVHLVVEVDPDIGEIEADPARFKQILVNLINNAIKFNRPQGSVVLELVRETHWMVATVTDTGIGIEAEDLPHLFGKFYQVDISASRRQEGTGLGLALTRDLVELHGGSITVESEKDVGTTITFRLPIKAPGPDLAASQRQGLDRSGIAQ